MDQRSLNPLAARIAARLTEVRERIADAGGDPETVRIVAVTKGRSCRDAAAAVQAGLADLGENYAQELVAKAAAVLGARWHFIGNLQANKVRRIADRVALWQSVDRSRLLTEIARHSPGAPILVQVASQPAPGRGGCDSSQVRGLVAEATDLGLQVQGLMTMALPAPCEDLRRQFRAVSVLADELGLAERSMGTSGDYLPAVGEGSTLLRLGRILFESP